MEPTPLLGFQEALIHFRNPFFLFKCAAQKLFTGTLQLPHQLSAVACRLLVYVAFFVVFSPLSLKLVASLISDNINVGILDEAMSNHPQSCDQPLLHVAVY